MIDENLPLEEVQRIFEHDRFATRSGCRIVEARPGHAVCELDVVPEHHLNEKGGVMGGAIFTLADFAMAVASNVGREPTVTVNATVDYMTGVRGTRLIATAEVDKDGRTMGFYHADVVDELGTPVARVTSTCMHAKPRS